MSNNEEKLRILAVEDEPVVRLYIQRVLEDLGHELVDTAESAEEAMRAVRSHDLDLVLMDIHIAGKTDGIETADTIHKEKGLPVIFLTAHGDKATVTRAARSKPYGYVVKPFNENDIEAAITLAMSRADSETVSEPIELGEGFFYDPGKRRLSKDEETVALTKKEQLLLHILTTEHGEVIPYDRVSEFVWRLDEASSANSLRDLVYRLRKKMPGISITSTAGIGISLNKP